LETRTTVDTVSDLIDKNNNKMSLPYRAIMNTEVSKVQKDLNLVKEQLKGHKKFAEEKLKYL
jgi:hypothetical protein